MINRRPDQLLQGVTDEIRASFFVLICCLMFDYPGKGVLASSLCANISETLPNP